MEGSLSPRRKIFRHLHCKINSLTLGILIIPLVSFGANGNIENQVIHTLNTKLVVSVDNKTISFDTKAIDIEDALDEQNISIGSKDFIDPPLQTKLSGGNINVNIIREVPILLDDDGKSSIIYSGYSDEKEALKQNGIKVFEEDLISSDLIFDFYQDGSAGKKITIKRAPTYYINVDGGTKEVRSWAKTVRELLAEEGVLASEKDKITPRLDSLITNKTEIVIVRVRESEVEETEAIEFAEKVTEDINTFIGNDFIKQKGVNGIKKKTYKIISENGIMISKTLIKSEITKEPVIQIKIKGAKPYNATTLWPTIVAASSQFGVSPTKMHSVMLCESGGNPYSGSFYKGLFQYHPDTWAGASSQYPGGVYRGASIYDPTAQIYVTAWKVSKQGWGAWGCA